MMIRLLIILLAFTFGANANSMKIAEELIEQEILGNMDDYDPDMQIEVNITKGRKAIEDDVVESVELTNLEVDSERKSFEGLLKVNDIISQEISGKYKRIVKIPAVNAKLRRNEVIEARHISYVDIDEDRISRGYITDELEIIGKSPVRTLFKNRPVLPKQIAEPRVVERKQSVTMIFSNGVMQIQAAGVAIEDGSLNEMIRVRNVDSNVIIHAKVVGENLVQVQSHKQIMASNF